METLEAIKRLEELERKTDRGMYWVRLDLVREIVNDLSNTVRHAYLNGRADGVKAEQTRVTCEGVLNMTTE